MRLQCKNVVRLNASVCGYNESTHSNGPKKRGVATESPCNDDDDNDNDDDDDDSDDDLGRPCLTSVVAVDGDGGDGASGRNGEFLLGVLELLRISVVGDSDAATRKPMALDRSVGTAAARLDTRR